MPHIYLDLSVLTKDFFSSFHSFEKSIMEVESITFWVAEANSFGQLLSSCSLPRFPLSRTNKECTSSLVFLIIKRKQTEKEDILVPLLLYALRPETSDMNYCFVFAMSLFEVVRISKLLKKKKKSPGTTCLLYIL